MYKAFSVLAVGALLLGFVAQAEAFESGNPPFYPYTHERTPWIMNIAGNSVNVTSTIDQPVDVVLQVVAKNGSSLAISEASLVWEGDAESPYKSLAIPMTKEQGITTLQIFFFNDGEPIGMFATVYDNGRSCFMQEVNCLSGYISGGIHQGSYYSYAWGWNRYPDQLLVYVGGADYIPICYVNDKIMCSPDERALVDSLLGY